MGTVTTSILGRTGAARTRPGGRQTCARCGLADAIAVRDGARFALFLGEVSVWRLAYYWSLVAVVFRILDVGGGAVTDATEYALADIPLRWMVREVMLAQCGITFEEAALTRWNIPLTATEAFKKQTSKPSSPAPGAASPVSANGKDSVENGGDGGNGQNGKGLKRADSVSSWVATRELADAVQPMDDELKKQPLWWILEILPTKYSYQDVAGKWITFWRCVRFLARLHAPSTDRFRIYSSGFAVQHSSRPRPIHALAAQVPREREGAHGGRCAEVCAARDIRQGHRDVRAMTMQVFGHLSGFDRG